MIFWEKLKIIIMFFSSEIHIYLQWFTADFDNHNDVCNVTSFDLI